MTVGMRRLPSIVLGTTLLLRAGVCLAQTESPVELVWTAPENCPQQVDVQHQLMTLMGQPNGARTTSPLRVNGMIEPLGERYRLTLSIERSTNHGTREVESEDCKSLGKAAAVIVGLLVQKERLLGRELSTVELSGQPSLAAPPETAPPPPKPKPPPTVAPPAPKPASQPRAWRLLFRVPEAKLDALLLPRTSYGLGLATGVAFDSWRVLLSGTVFESQSHSTTGPQVYTAKYQHRAVEAAGCGRIRGGSFELAPCALASGNYIVSKGSGEHLASLERSTVVFSAGGGINMYWHLQHYMSLVASGSARFTVNRAEFLVNLYTGPENAHKIPIGTVGATLACEWYF